MTPNRRQFLAALSGAVGTSLLANTTPLLAESAPAPLPIACNSYTWNTFYGREKKVWMANPDESLTDFVASGLTAYEPSMTSADDAIKLAPYLKKYKLDMRSIYVNSELHDPVAAQKSINTAISIAEAAKPLGTRIVVTNPNPLKWGTPDNKSDAQLAEQAKNLDRLGAELRQRGLTLAYHTHDPEFRAGAREFYHMMLNTDPKNVAFCLDSHWIFRGAGDSQLALFDVVKLFGKRIVELHVRQSKGGIWQETFSDGDIDYRRLARELKAINVRPHIVLEQCIEAKSPNTMGGVAAHKQDLVYAREVFG